MTKELCVTTDSVRPQDTQNQSEQRYYRTDSREPMP